MAQLVVAAAGAALGGFIAPGIVAFGMTGASIGWMAGSMLGSAFAPTQKSSGPQLSDLSVGTSAYGTAIPYVTGHPRIAGQIVWASNKREITTTEEAGKGGGGSEYTTYTYEVDLLILLTDNEIAGVSRVWSNGELVFSALEGSSSESILASYGNALWQRLTVYTGGPAQLPDPDYEASVGTANAPAYRGRGSLFIKSLQLGGSGQIPNLTFEICGPQSSTLSTPQTVLCAAMIRGATNPDRKYGIQYTAEPTWDSYWGEIGDGAVNFYNDEPAGLFDSGVLDASIFPIFTNAVYFFGGESQSAGSTARATFEFLNPSNGIVGVIQIDSDDPLFDVYYGQSGSLAINTRGGAGSSGINGNITFESGGIRFARTAATNDSFFISCNGLSVSSVRIRNVRVTQPGYIGFGSGAVIFRRESLLFPLFTRTNSTISSLVSELCQRTGLAPSQYDTTALAAITRPVRSMTISSVSSARTVLDMLAQSYHFEAVLSDKIYFRPRASAPAATLTFNELGVVVDSGSTPDPLPLTQANELEIPAQMALTYSNVDGDYQTDTQYSDRLLTGQESTSAMTLPLGFTSSEAKQIVDAMLLDKAVSALTTSVSMGLTRAALEPTDVVLLTGEDGSTYRMRIVKKAEASGVTTFDCVQDDSTVFTQTGTTAGGTASQTTVLPTPTTTLELLDVPLLRDVDNLPGHYVAVKGSAANWSSCALYESADDLTYTQNTVISGGAVMGACTTTLGAWLGGNFVDESSVLTVNVGAGQLSSVTHEGMLSSAATNAAIVGDEIIQFREAALVSAGVYDLRGLLRGKRGTEWATGTHSSAERFVLLSGAGMRFIAQQTSDVGKLIYYKAATSGQKLSAVASQGFTLQANVLKPLSPVNIRNAGSSVGSFVLSWDKRTRLSENWLAGTFASGEAVESYEIEILKAGSVWRTYKTNTPNYTYSAAMQFADFGSYQFTLDCRVRQIGKDGINGHAQSAILTRPTVYQTNSLALSGVVVAGLTVTLYAGESSAIASYITTAVDTLDSVAISFAAAIDATQYTASASGSTVTITGPVLGLITASVSRPGFNNAFIGLNIIAAASPARLASRSAYTLFVANPITGITDPLPAGATISLYFAPDAAPSGGTNVSYTTTSSTSKDAAFGELASLVRANSQVTGMGWAMGGSSVFGAQGTAFGPVGKDAHMQGGGVLPWNIATSKSEIGLPASSVPIAQSVEFAIGAGDIYEGDVFSIVLDGVSYNATATAVSTIESLATSLSASIHGALFTSVVSGVTSNVARVLVTSNTANLPFQYNTAKTNGISIIVT